MININNPSPKIEVIENIQRATVVENMAPSKTIASKEQRLSQGIIHPAIEDQDVVDAFRTLRTELLSRMKSFNSVILVSSTKSGGGASFTAVNLATAFAFDRNKTVLLIDCNFENPSLSTILDIKPEYGLKDFISGNVSDIKEIVSPTSIPRLRLVACGSNDVNEGEYREFFSENNMTTFLDEVKNRYPDRVIILDAPSVLESADTKILAQLSDYLLMVLPYKGASTNDVNKVLKSVDREKILGFIINN